MAFMKRNIRTLYSLITAGLLALSLVLQPIQFCCCLGGENAVNQAPAMHTMVQAEMAASDMPMSDMPCHQPDTPVQDESSDDCRCLSATLPVATLSSSPVLAVRVAHAKWDMPVQMRYQSVAAVRWSPPPRIIS